MYRYLAAVRRLSPAVSRSFTKVINSGTTAPKRELKGKEPVITLVAITIYHVI